MRRRPLSSWSKLTEIACEDLGWHRSPYPCPNSACRTAAMQRVRSLARLPVTTALGPQAAVAVHRFCVGRLGQNGANSSKLRRARNRPTACRCRAARAVRTCRLAQGSGISGIHGCCRLGLSQGFLPDAFRPASSSHQGRTRLPLGPVLYKRRWTGEILNDELRARFPTRDWVLTRALWLQGLERDLKRGGDVDTLRRLIYIHGTHEEDLVDQPVSFGCVRMRNADIIELFDRVPQGCLVSIE